MHCWGRAGTACAQFLHDQAGFLHLIRAGQGDGRDGYGGQGAGFAALRAKEVYVRVVVRRGGAGRRTQSIFHRAAAVLNAVPQTFIGKGFQGRWTVMRSACWSSTSPLVRLRAAGRAVRRAPAGAWPWGNLLGDKRVFEGVGQALKRGKGKGGFGLLGPGPEQDDADAREANQAADNIEPVVPEAVEIPGPRDGHKDENAPVHGVGFAE